jgi:hypothetical protein
MQFETSDAEAGWLRWDFSTPVIVTRVDWLYLQDEGSRSGGVTVTGASGGYGLIKSGAQQHRIADWGDDCLDCPKGGSIRFKATDGNLFGGFFEGPVYHKTEFLL